MAEFVWLDRTQTDLQQMVAEGRMADLSSFELLDAVVHIATWLGCWADERTSGKGKFHSNGNKLLKTFREELETRLSRELD